MSEENYHRRLFFFFFVALKRKVCGKFSSETLFDFGAKSHDFEIDTHVKCSRFNEELRKEQVHEICSMCHFLPLSCTYTHYK